MYKKNDVLELDILDQGNSGEGIGKVDGYAIFIKDAIIGDRVKVKIMKAKKNYAFGKLLEVLKPSSFRANPKCDVSTSCGGCQIQEMCYERQLKFKWDKVYNNIKRIGGIENFKMKDIIAADSQYFYRNKAQFPVREDRDGNIIYGFFAGRTHSIVKCESCALGLKVEGKDFYNKIMNIIINFMNEYKIKAYNEIKNTGLVRNVLIRIGQRTGEIMVCIIINGNKLPNSEKLVKKLCEIEAIKDISISINKTKGNTIMGDKVISLYGPGYIEDFIGNVKFRISAKSFYQVNPMQTYKLYSKALEYANLTGNELVWDLYCGIGTISLFLAKKAKKVIGVEIVDAAVENAKENAKINNIENAEFLVGAAEDVVSEYYSSNSDDAMKTPDVIVVDPPRKGCDEKLIETMLKMNANRIVYVSCDSATLARDLKILCENGYNIREVTPCDMFPNTTHVESVCLLSKGNIC